MSELDDLVASNRSRRDSEEAQAALVADHGAGLKTAPVVPALENVVADFVTRLAPSAGMPAYRVDRLSVPTVHAVPERVTVFSNHTGGLRTLLKHRASQMRAESIGESRILAVSVGDSHNGLYTFHFVRLNDAWEPAVEFTSQHPWPGSTSYLFDYAKSAMVKYLS